MNFPDAWATITGIAGILSLFLAINEKFSSWKKFTIPVCASLVGFALGRLTIVVSHDTGNFASENISIMVLEPKALPTYIKNQPDLLSQSDMMLASFHISRYIRTKEALKTK